MSHPLWVVFAKQIRSAISAVGETLGPDRSGERGKQGRFGQHKKYCEMKSEMPEPAQMGVVEAISCNVLPSDGVV